MGGVILSNEQLRDLLLARESSFAVGVTGVLAEFHWAPDDVIEADDGGLGISTARGGIRIVTGRGERLHINTSARTAAPTPLHPVPHGHDAMPAPQVYWLPADTACAYPSRGLTELGADAQALRTPDLNGVLFDMGLALGHVQACVRSADAALTGCLREHLGENILARGHPAMAAIKQHGPHRVFRSVMARIEVYQPIPSRARHERTPDGPHTHVLPRLMSRPDPTYDMLPPGARPVLSIYPRS